MFRLARLVGWWAIGGPGGAVCSLGSASAGCADGGRGILNQAPEENIRRDVNIDTNKYLTQIEIQILKISNTITNTEHKYK